MPTVTKREIAARNDALRKSLPLVTMPNKAVMTRGVAALEPEDLAEIMRKVREFSDFNADNDPYGEHDFGSINHDGTRYFWKVDDYGGHEGIRLLLTIMRADEY